MGVKNEGHTTEITLNFQNAFSSVVDKNRTVENCAILGYYAVCSGNSLPTFRDSLSIPPSRAHYTLRNSPEEHRSPLLRGDLKSRNQTIFFCTGGQRNSQHWITCVEAWTQLLSCDFVSIHNVCVNSFFLSFFSAISMGNRKFNALIRHIPFTCAVRTILRADTDYNQKSAFIQRTGVRC